MYLLWMVIEVCLWTWSDVKKHFVNTSVKSNVFRSVPAYATTTMTTFSAYLSSYYWIFIEKIAHWGNFQRHKIDNVCHAFKSVKTRRRRKKLPRSFLLYFRKKEYWLVNVISFLFFSMLIWLCSHLDPHIDEIERSCWSPAYPSRFYSCKLFSRISLIWDYLYTDPKTDHFLRGM